jgi:hypothetical protein
VGRLNVSVVASNQSNGADRFHHLAVVGMPFYLTAMQYNSDLHYHNQFGTSPLFQEGKYDSILVYDSKASNYGELFNYEIQILFLVLIILWKTYNPF